MGPRLRLSCLVAAVLVGAVGCSANSGGTPQAGGTPASTTTPPIVTSSVPPTPGTTEQQPPMPIDEDSPSTDAPVREARSTVVEQLVAVAADGRPTVGWSVTDGGTSWSGGVPEDCNGPSPAAVTAGVFACGYTARGSNACWPGPAAGTMVCLQDLWARSLFALQGYRPGTTTGPADAPAPIGLELENGLRCSLRKGGSWPSQDSDPSLAGAYSCTDGGPAGGDLTAVWVGPDAPAIDRSTAYWTARVGGTAGPLETVGVATAYFVAAE